MSVPRRNTEFPVSGSVAAPKPAPAGAAEAPPLMEEESEYGLPTSRLNLLGDLLGVPIDEPAGDPNVDLCGDP